eukprot:13570753-Alexandrium_andersonii.AAC.1
MSPASAAGRASSGRPSRCSTCGYPRAASTARRSSTRRTSRRSARRRPASSLTTSTSSAGSSRTFSAKVSGEA